MMERTLMTIIRTQKMTFQKQVIIMNHNLIMIQMTSKTKLDTLNFKLEIRKT